MARERSCRGCGRRYPINGTHCYYCGRSNPDSRHPGPNTVVSRRLNSSLRATAFPMGAGNFPRIVITHADAPALELMAAELLEQARRRISAPDLEYDPEETS
jgi:hypothetical protein